MGKFFFLASASLVLFFAGCSILRPAHDAVMQRSFAESHNFDVSCRDLAIAIEKTSSFYGMRTKLISGNYLRGGTFTGPDVEITFQDMGENRSKMSARFNVIGNKNDEDAFIKQVCKELGQPYLPVLKKDSEKTKKEVKNEK